MTTIPSITDTEAAHIAADWHSGQSSPLYSLASTYRVHSEQHRTELLAELSDCLLEAGSIGPRRTDLYDLIDWVRAYDLNEEEDEL